MRNKPYQSCNRPYQSLLSVGRKRNQISVSVSYSVFKILIVHRLLVGRQVCRLFLCPKIDVLLAASCPYNRQEAPDSISAVVLLYQRQDTVFFQKLINKKPAFLRPIRMELCNRLAVFIIHGKGLKAVFAHSREPILVGGLDLQSLVQLTTADLLCYTIAVQTISRSGIR